MIESWREALAAAKRDYLERVMAAADGCVSVAAKMAEYNRTSFSRTLNEYAPHIVRRGESGRHRASCTCQACRPDLNRSKAIGGNRAWKALDETEARL